MDHGVHQSTLATPKIWQPAIATGTLWPLVPVPYILLLKWTQWHPCIYRAESHWCAVVSLSLSYTNQIINVCFLIGYICCKILVNESAIYLLVFLLPPYGFLLFSLLVVFLLQECPISLIPGVVQVLSYQAVVGSQPILLNILEKTESFLLFGAHHSSIVSTAFWLRHTENVNDNCLP